MKDLESVRKLKKTVSENTRYIQFKIEKDTHDEFMKFCREHKLNVSAILRNYVRDILNGGEMIDGKDLKRGA